MLLLLYRRNRRPKRPSSLKIYEAHVGMSGEDEAVSTYAQFRDEVLPRIKKQGYTAIQLMAIQVGLEPGTWCSFFLFWRLGVLAAYQQESEQQQGRAVAEAGLPYSASDWQRLVCVSCSDHV